MGQKEGAFFLDEESMQRLERLKALIPDTSEAALIRLGLKSLEQKVDRVLRKRLAQRIRRLKKEGMSHEEIADYLNEKGIPAARSGQRWGPHTVRQWLGEEARSKEHRAWS